MPSLLLRVLAALLVFKYLSSKKSPPQEPVVAHAEAQAAQGGTKSYSTAAWVCVAAAGVCAFMFLMLFSGLVRLPASKPPASQIGVSSADWSGVYREVNPGIAQVLTEAGSSGTGFFVSDTQVVTAAHVATVAVEEDTASKTAELPGITVRTSDGRERKAVIQGIDSRADVALLELDSPATGVAHLHFTNLATASIGEPVATIGYPFGESEMMSSGILSGYASNSSFATDSAAQNWMIQTDTPVNPGNSGGPLLDMNGHVVGIVVLRPDDVGERSVESISLAVPSSTVVAVINSFAEGLGMSYARIGVTVRDANADDKTHPGVAVKEVAKGGPGAKGGIRAGDVITALGGEPAKNTDDLFRLLAQYREGDTLTLDLTGPDGSDRQVRVVAGERLG